MENQNPNENTDSTPAPAPQSIVTPSAPAPGNVMPPASERDPNVTLPAPVSPSEVAPASPFTPAPVPPAQVPPQTPAAAEPTPPAPTPAYAEPLAPPATQSQVPDEPQQQYGPPPDVTWQAAEFIDHRKSIGWYLAFVGVSLALLAAGYLISHDIITMIVIVICAGLFGFMASRKPRIVQYGLNRAGVFINNKFYPYSEFNAFAVVDEGQLSSINFLPLKRFAPMLSITYTAENENRIIDVLAQHLPFAQHQRTMIDGLMHRIHF